uniref:Uncharacterized protein n=1 Tax=Pelusios castaneus TaxID=367368 RepID=A0A8C8VLE4_9SAUR
MAWRELLPSSLVILAGLIGILLLCVTTKDVQNPPRCKYDWTERWSWSRKRTVGVMVIREASTQITFKIKERSIDPENEVTLQLYGQAHRIYTNHFHCYGTNQLLKRLLLKAIQDQGYMRNVYNPCWPLSYSCEVPFGFLHAGPCAASSVPKKSPASKDVFHIIGSSNSSACRKLMRSLLNSSSFCSFPQCSPNGVFQPNITRFQVISEALDLVKKIMTSTDLGQAVESLCGMSMEELSRRFQMKPDSLADLCFVSTFIYHLSTRGYLFDLDSSDQVTFQKVGDTSSGWALGYMLNLTNTIPEDKPNFLKGIEYGVWPLLFILFVLLLTGSFARIAYRVMTM